MKQYIGENEVETIYSTEHKTPSKGDIIRVVYVGDSKDELMSRLMFDKVVTEEVSDATELREARVVPMAEAILTVMTDWGLKLNEMDYLWQQKIIQSLNDTTDKAHAKLFEWETETTSTKHDITLLHYDIILNDRNKEESNTGAEK